MTTSGVAEAMEAGDRVPLVLDALKRLYGLTDGQIADAIGLPRSQDAQRRRTGITKVTPSELAGLAAFFRVSTDVFFLAPAQAVRAVLERDPELAGPSSACFTAVDGRWARVPSRDVGLAVG